MQHFFPAIILLAAMLAGCANFHVVSPGKVYRCGQPEATDVRRWADEYHLKTLLRLRGGKEGDSDYDRPRQATSDLGMAFVHLPMSASRFPKKHELVKLVEFFETAQYPVLIHCVSGSDRTGLASAVYHLMQGESVEAARSELKLFPYMHTGLFGTGAMRQVIDMYEPWVGVMGFAQWAREIYERPENDELTEDYFEQMKSRINVFKAGK